MTGLRARRTTLLGLLLLFAVALAPRVAAVLQYEARHPQADRPVIDEASYERWALALAAGDWVGDEVFFQEPLYPYWLGTVFAVFGHERTAARLLQAGLGALACVLVCVLGARRFGLGAGVVAGLALALYRPALLLPCLLLKPNLFLPVLAALAILLTGPAPRRPRLASLAAGALAGLGALLRGNALVLLPIVVLWPLLRRIGAAEAWASVRRRAAWTAAGAVLVLAPVALRNAAVGGVLVLTTSGAGTNLYGGNSPENLYGVATELPWVRGIPEYEADDWRREAERRLGRALEPSEVSRYWMGELWRSARRDPGLHAAILWRKLRLSLGSYEVPDNHDLEWDARFVPILRGPFPGFGEWGAVGLAGVFLLGGLAAAARRRPEGALAALRREVDDPRGALELALLFALYLATIVLTVTSMRIRIALVPLLLPFGGWFALHLVRRATGARGAWRRLMPHGLALAAAVCVVHLTVLPPGERERDLAERDYNLAVQLLEDPDGLARATELATGLVEAHPRTSRFRILLSEAEYRAGRGLLGGPERARGEELVRRALERLKPIAASPGVSGRERFQARRLAGWIQLELGNAGAAAGHLRRALEFDAEDAELRGMLVQALVEEARELGPGAERTARVAEAGRLYAGLAADDPPRLSREALERLGAELRDVQ